MRPIVSAFVPVILAALLAGASFGGHAVAQPAEPSTVQPTDTGIAIEWQVRSRFRLFRREADFQRHVIANRAGSQLAAEHLLERETGGRGWAQNMVDQLCVSATGAVADTCDRDGERENYLAPKNHLVVARLSGAVPPGARLVCAVNSQSCNMWVYPLCFSGLIRLCLLDSHAREWVPVVHEAEG